jgi:hypothetical protein
MQCKDVEEHSLMSPIWDVVITGIEVFYPGETIESPLSHALIVELPQVAREWGTMQSVRISGTTEIWPRYSTTDIKDMVRGPSVFSTAYSSPRLSKRRSRHPKVDSAMICSVRVRYNRKNVFLERDDCTWHSANGEGPFLTTEQIVGILSSA